MNNGEWLNTLDNEGKAKAIKDWYLSEYGTPLDWLNAPHKTTADEDFAEMGYLVDYDTRYYKHDEGSTKFFTIYENHIDFQMTDMDTSLTDKEIDQIRTIADKKRKEFGWK